MTITATVQHVTDIPVIEVRRLRGLFCSHRQTVHASAGTHCASCGRRV